jgi:ABC-2 type transport system ATP-binding protein
MIRADRLNKYYGRRHVVCDVSFEVGRGEVLGFLGPNGAGKTTTMRLLTGYLPPSSGTAEVNGFDVVRRPVEVRRSLGYLPESAPAYGDMTVEEFLRFIAEMRGFAGRDRNARADAVIETCFLSPVRRQTVDTLSKGYRQRTGFAQAILHDPPVLIMDEPTEGLDPNQKHVVRSMIRHMSREKVIVLSTHILEEVEFICSRVIIISDGRLVADDTPAALRRRSPSFSAVTVKLAAPAAEAAAAFRGLDGVAAVETLEPEGDLSVLRVFPRKGAGLVDPLTALARSKSWPIREAQVDEGRLDEVFRALTTTADTTGIEEAEGT